MNAARLPLVRAERESEAAAIAEVHERAFETDAEARLVEMLRRDGSIVLSLVAESEGRIAGSAIYSRLLIDGEDRGATALAPVAVMPALQKKGIGSLLIREAHRQLADMGERLVLVLGDPAYYARFGFSYNAVTGLRTPYDGPHLMALNFGSDRTTITATVTYPPAFAKLG